MRGAAAEAVMNINLARYTSEQLLAEFKRKFMPAAASTLAQTNFEQAVMRAGESVLSWHSRLFSLWKRAYPTMEDETLLIRRFALGITNIDMRREILRQRPALFDEALNIAQTEEAVNKATQRTAINQAIMPAPTLDEPMDINAMGGNVRCFRCRQEGHIQKDCPKPAPKPGSNFNAQKGGTFSTKKFKGNGRKAQPRDRQERRRRFKKMINAIGEVMEDFSEYEDGSEAASEDEGEEASLDQVDHRSPEEGSKGN
jgi:hypothetical protein